jgi:hypothetical protein
LDEKAALTLPGLRLLFCADPVPSAVVLKQTLSWRHAQLVAKQPMMNAAVELLH